MLNLTRIERSHQLAREKIARRGYKLLKDKSVEIDRKLDEFAAGNAELREKLDQEIIRAEQLFMEASANMSQTELQNAISSMQNDFSAKKNIQKIMGIEVPKIDISKNSIKDEIFYSTTHPSFDRSIAIIKANAEKLIALACAEKSRSILENELKKIRHRINALEYKVIPEIQSNIRFITLKLAENDRGNLVRLMKVKEILQETK